MKIIHNTNKHYWKGYF